MLLLKWQRTHDSAACHGIKAHMIISGPCSIVLNAMAACIPTESVCNDSCLYLQNRFWFSAAQCLSLSAKQQLLSVVVTGRTHFKVNGNLVTEYRDLAWCETSSGWLRRMPQPSFSLMRLMPSQLPALMLRQEQTGIAGCNRPHIVSTFTKTVLDTKEKTMPFWH